MRLMGALGMGVLALALALAGCGVGGQDPGGDPSVGSFRAAREAAVRAFGDRAVAEFGRREELLGTCGCAVHACGYQFGDGGRCMEFDFPKEGDYGCKDEICHVEKFDFTHSYVRTPPAVDITRIEDFKEVAEEICIYQALDDDNFFHGIMSAEVGNESFVGWAYIATRSGVVRVWPGLPAKSFKANTCPEFDPRLRPWYIEALTGPKNLAIVVESPGTNSDWESSKAAIVLLLRTLSHVDFANIIIFGQDASLLGGRSLLKTNRRNTDRFSQALDDVVALESEVVDYGNALELAFQLFNSTPEQLGDKSISECQKVIILIASSPDCSEVDPSSCSSAEATNAAGGSRAGLLSGLQDMQAATSGSSAIFTYKVGSDLDPGLLQQIACRGGGAFGHITEDEEPVVSLSSFFDFANIAFPNNGGTTWTEPYIDAWGIGEISTITVPLFATNGTLPRCFLGVAAVDVPTAELDPSISVFDIIREVEDETHCLPANGSFENCDLQAIRGEAHQCQTPLPSSKCYNFTDTAGGSKLYSISEATTFEAAEALCASLGGGLPQIDSAEEQQFLSGIAPPDRAWMGLTKVDNSSKWEWANGTAVAQEAQLWVSGEVPSGEQTGSCAVLDPGSTFQNVRSANCSELFSVICEGIPEDAEGCEDTVRMVSWEDLTMSVNAEESTLKCTTVDSCDAFSIDSLKPVNTICPIGEPENFEKNGCCECKDGADG